MPTTVWIGMFVLGSVLLLLAIGSGTVEIFGAKIVGQISRRARYFSGLAGVLLLLVSTVASLDIFRPHEVGRSAEVKNNPAASPDAPKDPQPTSRPSPDPRPRRPEAPAGHPEVQADPQVKNTQANTGPLYLGRSLPQIWEGTFDQKGYGSYPMIVSVERVSASSFFGEINWPTLQNSIVSLEGELVSEVTNFAEATNWRLVEGFNPGVRQTLLRFTSGRLIRGGGVSINGSYYARLAGPDVVHGIFFMPNGSAPLGTFSIMRREN